MKRTHALLVIVATFLALFWPCLLRGFVVYPHDNAQETGLSREAPDSWPSNRKFSDTSSFYVPEVHEHLHGDHEAWLATWNPNVELGRPLGQVSGFSPAFLLTRVLAWTTDDAFVLLTRITLVTFLLAALFAYFFLEELGVKVEVACGVACALVFGPYATYWITCVLFAAGWCWTFLLLWLVASFVRVPSGWKGLGIAFGAHALLMTSYPQQIVWHLYALVPFTIHRAWKHGGERRVARLVGIGGCAIAGVLCALPVYADLALAAQRSTRGTADHTFFLQTLTGMNGTGEPWLFLAQLFDAFWIGDPMSEARAFSGVTLTPFLAAGLALACVGGALRRSWGWLVLVAAGIAMAFSKELYFVGVDYLGLSFSRYTPMAGALIPAAVAAAYGFDAALKRVDAVRFAWCCASIPPIAIAVVTYALRPAPLSWGWVAIGVAVYVATVVAAATKRAWSLVALGVLAALAWGRAEVLMRPRDAIATTSPFVEDLRARTKGLRYAGAGDVVSRLLPPNQESVLGLSSIHSFNSLSSRAYQDWVTRVSETGTRTYGRQFRKITSAAKLEDGELALAGVVLIASEIPLESPAVERVGEFGSVTYYAPREAPVHQALFTEFTRDEKGTRVDVRGTARAFAGTVNPRDDRLLVGFEPPAKDALLFVSQQFHPQWKASADGRELETVAVNGFYQGVIVPAGAREAELVFEPWSLLMWIPQLLFVLAAFACVVATVARRRPASAAGR
ncbi:MAG: hypothetical protein IPJ77_10275 [Planctomycetes bacterium]|nr:hypothetical protein [Planctomycetota bacterium]